MVEDNTFAPLDWQNLILRLAIALIVGVIIGLERETQNKPAGLRTNMLVCFGSAMAVIVPIEIGAAQQNLDVLGRAISGVLSGVGFIGGGTILRNSRVHGLTSASAIWVSAALGIAAGCGLWLLSLGGALITWIILNLFKKWEKRF